MTDSEAKAAKKKPPKGGRKGGALFPKINLEQAVEYARKLVSKTHTGPQAEKTILPGVFGNAGPKGKVRASALKQYGLLEGPSSAYKATQLAKDMGAALEQDLPPLLQRAFLNAKLFKQIFDILHGDTVSKAKVEQRAKGLNVHPESADECAQLFIDSAVTAKLGILNGESLALVKAGGIAPAEGALNEDDTEIEEHEDEAVTADVNPATPPDAARTLNNGSQPERERTTPPHLEKPAVALSLTVDATSDPDKLEKQLKLLRQYGVI
ncbi:MAG: hypothetical protein JO108_08970 [Acidobacteriaceae bacterium]|nr:hypothetical protein [Acidobacteriaceae bacterium]